MRIARWPEQRELPVRSSVATLGMFDGVHRGHQEVLSQAVEAARRRSCSSAVVTFDRHPSQALSRYSAPSVTSLEHRLHVFECMGMDIAVVMCFGRSVAAMTAADFVRRVFHELLHAELLVLGFDCRFGRGREGDVELCRALGPELGFEVSVVPPVEVDGEAIHSTDIRQAVLAGDLRKADRLLGRRFSLYGTVVHGEDRGHGLGYPTANLDVHNELLPPDGVYACMVCVGSRTLPAVASIGRRRTFHPETSAERVAEVHILDGEAQLYGESIEVRLVRRLRGQVAFEGTDALRAQIAHDVRSARRALDDVPDGA